MWNDLVQIGIVLLILFVLMVPMGKYLYIVFGDKESKLDRIFLPFEKVIYRISGIRQIEEMTWKKYAVTLLAINGILGVIAYFVLRFQGGLPLNPAKIENMEPSLIFNTITSFLTNTNLQHYSGESGLSVLSQMLVITMFMFTYAATGLAVCIAFIRGLSSKGRSIGNFYQDWLRAHTRVLIPLSLIVTLTLVALGVPQTLDANVTVQTLEGGKQTIAMGPVASLESIKHLGTNGGGFFGVNSSHPFENPNVFTNIIEILSMWIIPASLPFTYGRMVKNSKQGWVIFGVMLTIFLLLLSLVYSQEKAGNPAFNELGFSHNQGSMEGKEVRFGIPMSALFTSVTTAATTGTVNNMHDTLTPLGGLVPLSLMMLNSVFGGEGVGLMNMLMYAILAVFLSGLMVGRTPEFLGRKIEAKEMKLIVIALLAHPLIILMPSAIALGTTLGTEAISDSGFHGISQVLYEYTSSAANNGSGFEGLGDNTIFWNTTTGLVMLFGRYISMVVLLAVAGSLITKQPVPETLGTFRTDNATFGTILIGTVIIIGALTFFPVLVLGPVAEYLTIR
ncbi:potassium-transporting ATPase subunit KdpA [Thermoflavimicrobium daqui]|uniref:Potassium-transporting ATPase potassium-binding subunit n=1 Tax=Thermoflavimicrobium daqui TaxID=2137476 RepID=A0A364K9X2_9BACL|nr:potassium-transporting ATPase subunit KdpA [Thermoflavimicrobium daqui]RAL27078.1 potassium-transporting ATPase subunit KdpA [Thermoflavimicrobium daqui]